MTTEPVKQLSDEVVEPYGLTVDKLRDLWLMVKGALPLTAEAEVACCPEATCSGCPEPTYCESLRPAGGPWRWANQRWLYLNDPKLWSRKVELTGDCSVDCTEHCQYPGQFSECS
jgi:hypothetical protein